MTRVVETVKLIVKPKCKYCWLLFLLLLPFLLLIPINKTIRVRVIQGKNTVANIPLNFNYIQRELYSFKYHKFFTRYWVPDYPMIDTTDSNGIAEYKLRYTLYQWIFRNKDSAIFFYNDDCRIADSIYKLFSLGKKPVNLYLNYITTVKTFTVVDADDGNDPLPNALVIIEYDGIIDSIKTNPAGEVSLNMPICAKVKIMAKKYGWYPDSVSGVFDEIRNTLYLRQEKEIIKFYVKDVKTHNAIVGAHGYLFIEGNSKYEDDAITNIRGVGKGVFHDSIHILKKIKIDVNKYNKLIYYYDTSTVDYLGYITIDNWINKPDSQKIIYLRPRPYPLIFKNVDCKTKKGLPNIKNKITIYKADGSTTTYTVISNSNGEFTISADITDLITIKAENSYSCPNEYNDNDTAIVKETFKTLKENANKRIIPMCKKAPPKVKFRDIDDSLHTGIGGVKNKIYVDGHFVKTIVSAYDGSFYIDFVYSCQKISIIADGRDVKYTINDITIKNVLYRKLIHAPQNKRDIPLNRPEYVVDIVFVVDATGSMSDEISSIKSNILNIGPMLKEKMVALYKYPEIIRLRIIGFNENYGTDCFASKFYYIPDQMSELKTEVSSLSATGWGEFGFEALKKAFYSDWQKIGKKRVKIIIFFSDDRPYASFGEVSISDTIHSTDLRPIWNSLQPNSFLILFLDKENLGEYDKITSWPNVILKDIHEYSFDSVIEEIAKKM